MKTPREKYMEDPYYHALIDTMFDYMEEARFSPSELIQAVVLASVLFEKAYDNMKKRM